MTTDQINEPAEDGSATQPAAENAEPVADDAITITSADIVNEFGAELKAGAVAAPEPEAPAATATEETAATPAEADRDVAAPPQADEPEARAASQVNPPAQEVLAASPKDDEEDSGGRHKQRMRPASSKEIRRVQAAFAACVRCGYFLSDYRMLFGEEHFAEVVGRSRGDWLDLNWSEELRIIVEKSFGVRMDSDLDYYQGCCDLCRRTFIYSAGDDIEATMRVQVRMDTPQPRKSGRRRR